MQLRPALLLLPLAACQATAPPTSHAVTSPLPPRVDDEPTRVVEAVQRGDYREARELLGELIVQQNRSRALEALAVGDGEAAMILLDEALELRKDDAALLALRGRAAYAAAEAVLADPSSGANPQFFYEDALEHLQQAGSRYAAARDAEQVVRIAFDASRAARRIPDPERALALARGGAERLAAIEGGLDLEPPAVQVHAEAAFDVFIARLRGGGDAEEAYLETEDQLMTLLGQRPTDPWPLQQLSNLYQWNGDMEGAITTIERALELSPDNQALHDRLMQVVPAERGWPALVADSTARAARHPGSAVVQRNAGVAGLFGALAAFDQGDYDPAPFREAEAAFVRAAGLDEALSADCLGYQAIVRDAIGWCHYNAGDYTAAKDAFLSMEDVFEGGLLWQLPGRLPDGVAGLGFVIGKLAEDPNSLSATEDVAEAAAIADYLFAYHPEDGNHANNAGFMNRDASVLYERKSRLVRGQAERVEDDAERRALVDEATRLMDRAHELMAKSKVAYLVAARLLPDDVRVVNDAGLVIVYYTRDDAEVAEKLFLRAVELGEQQLEDTTLSEEDRYALNEAWGDAHQNLAVLELTMRRDGAKARPWLERALEIGPPSRERISSMLDVCDEMARDSSLDLSAYPIVRNLVWLHSPR